MKRTLTLLVFIVVLNSVSSSQGIYIKAGGGYGFPAATSVLGEKDSRTQVTTGTNTTNTNSTQGVSGSYGAGVNFNLGLGYKFNQNFIFEFNAQYLLSNKYKTGSNYKYTTAGVSSYEYYNTTTSAKALFLNPSFVLSAGFGFGKATPYGRFGLIIGLPKVSGSELSYNNGDGVDSSRTRWEYSKGVSFGFQGAIGMNWKINEELDLFTEINFVSMTYYPGVFNLTQDKNLLNNYNYLPNMSLSQKQTTFRKRFDPSAVNTNSAQPHVAVPEAKPFSSASLQFGIRYSLWKIKQ